MAGLDPTKAKLLEAAGEEFAEKGFEAATVRSICARAGMNLAAVNYHFGDKEQLYLQAIMEAHRCGAELPSDEQFFVGTPAEQLRRFIRHFLSHILVMQHATGWHQKLIVREMLRPTQALEVLVREAIRPKFNRLLRILEQVCPEATTQRLSLIGFSVIGQCLHYKMARPIMQHLIGENEFATLDVDALTDHIAGFTLAALGVVPPLDAAGETTLSVPAEGAAP